MQKGAAACPLVAEVAAALLQPALARLDEADIITPLQEDVLCHSANTCAAIDRCSERQLRPPCAQRTEKVERMFNVLFGAAVPYHSLLITSATIAISVPPSIVCSVVLSMMLSLIEPQRLEARKGASIVIAAGDEWWRRSFMRSAGWSRCWVGRRSGKSRHCTLWSTVRLANRHSNQVIIAQAFRISIARQLHAATGVLTPQEESRSCNVFLLEPQLVCRRLQ
mmetsp:Transcript_57927/g.114992  ORF Transcript_57927/g.114992 Transcript_57927/m.114992 type:complete len:223 (-) Transcript_57927:200-868(-)